MSSADVPSLVPVKVRFVAGFSGGPLMLHDRVLDQYEIIGVTSWGLGCGDPLYPGIYTR